VISMTSNTTGTLIVQVFKGDKATGTPVKTSIVDTYYGMNKDGSISLNNPEAIWQVPVMKIFGLTYGQYTVKIIAGWNDYFDHKDESNSYDLYLDAIRIYDPTGNQDDVANGAYKDDGEGWPVYAEVRDLVIKADSFNQGLADVSGVVFIDCVDETNVIADYKDYGPNNELYLANGQAIAFKLALDSNVADVQIGMKAANGVYAAYEIYNATTGESIISDDLNTTTDMYYSIGDKVKNGDVIVIKNNENTTGSILSLTNIKVTHLSGTTGASVANVVHVDDEAATNAVNAMALIKPVLPTFNPETMNVRFNRTTAAIGNNVVITVTTSTDVENLLINGQVATNKATSYVTGETVWSFTVPVVENGSLDVRIVGFDADGQFTIPHSETVTVVNMSGTQEDLLGKLFG